MEMKPSKSQIRVIALGIGCGLAVLGVIAETVRGERELESECAQAELVRRGFEHCRVDLHCIWTPELMGAAMDNVEFLDTQCHPLGRLEQ